MKRVVVFSLLVGVFLTVDARVGARPLPNAGAGQDAETAQSNKGQPTGSKFTPAERRSMVSLHNAARAAVGVSPLTWSPELATFAQKWATQLARTNCVAQQRPASGEWKELYGSGVYGGKGPAAGPAEAFAMWERSKKFYQGQPVSASDLRAANYTQLVWSATTQFGCGKAVCSDGTVIVICNYDPKGNVVGEKPY
jgi:pathogenesis-related protein 1